MVALLCAACAPAAPRDHSSPRPGAVAASAVIDSTITAAQAETYANEYAAAATTYTGLTRRFPGSAQAHAAYALFLDYRGDGADAASEASRAVALDQHSAVAYAVLCRTRDWAGDPGGAVTAGRTAVTLSAAEPLARLFLSEALADDGDIAGSQAQLDAAKPLVTAQSSRYLQAELQREAGNLAADSGRLADQVAALMPTVSLQPGWLYRTQELVAAEASTGQPDTARQTLDTAVATLPGDIDALEGVGYTAVSIGDAALARAVWERAVTVAPDDPSALQMAGEIQVAVNHDINAGVAAMQHALAVNPHDDVAAAYLTGLERFVLHASVSPDPSGSLASDARRALDAVNAARAQAGLPPVALDQRLSDSATSHSFYWLFNNLAATSQGLGIHQEAAGLPGFTGATLADRDHAFGYPALRLAEDITHRDSPVSAVGDWVNSVFHRFPIMRPDLVAIGFGEAQVGAITMQDMEFGYGAVSTTTPVGYPASGQSQVPVMFVDNELPDPVPQGKQRTTGYPVTVTFDYAESVSMSSFTLTGPDGVAVNAYLLTPSQSTENSASLLPAIPLRPSTTYTAHLSGTVDGRAVDQSWSFTTSS